MHYSKNKSDATHKLECLSKSDDDARQAAKKLIEYLGNDDAEQALEAAKELKECLSKSDDAGQALEAEEIYELIEHLKVAKETYELIERLRKRELYKQIGSFTEDDIEVSS